MKDRLTGTVRDVKTQHRVIRAFLATIGGSISRQEHEDEITFLFFQARAYILSHFETEEGFMKSTGYPEFGGHKWQHRFITNELDRISEAVRSGSAYRVEDHRLVRDLVADHNDKTDTLFLNYCDKRATPVIARRT